MNDDPIDTGKTNEVRKDEGMLRGLLLSGLLSGLMMFSSLFAWSADPWLSFEGSAATGQGKHIVLIGGDEEYRSEESLPQLAKILSTRHGFRCTVLFAIDRTTGEINPKESGNIPGTAALATADLMIIATRFRNLPEDQMKPIIAYLDSGKPVIGLRTATHAFNFKADSPFAKYSYNSNDPDYPKGFGKQVLGETWVAHHGNHGKEATRGMLVKEEASHPILRGIKDGDIFGPTDVYRVTLPLPEGSKPLVLGQVVAGMKPEDPAVEGEKNSPMQPVAWIKSYRSASGKTGRVFTTTMGAATDFNSEGLRRLVVNATFWCVGLEDKITDKTNVDLVGDYKPTPFGFGTHVPGKFPVDYR